MSALQPNICKAFTVDVYQRLKQAGVMTVVDFVTRDKEELSQSCGIAFKVTVTELGIGESETGEFTHDHVTHSQSDSE